MSKIDNIDSKNNISNSYDLSNKSRYKLDNAATVFSFVSSKRIPCLYRLSASLNKPINIKILQRAFEDILPRFPYFSVNLRPSFSWYYWKKVEGKPSVILDEKYPCQEMPIRKKGILPFRVRAFQNRIAVEFHHSLTDGTGAITFLRALVSQYLHLQGVEVKDWQDVFRPDQQPDPEEFEDAFKRYYKKVVPEPRRIPYAFHLPYKLEKKGIYHIITGSMPVKDVLKISKGYNVTLTEFLTSVYLASLQDILFDFPEKIRKKMMKPIRLMIPVNLRRIYPSKTMRNFSLYVTPGINPKLGRYSFDEILKEVYHYMRVEVNDKYINQQIKRNVRGEIHPAMQVIPLFIKRMFGKLLYYNLGEYLYSGVLTNLGRVSLPEPLNDHINKFEFYPAPSPVTKTDCAVVSYKDTLYITFGRVIREAEVERLFFSKIRKMGVHVKIDSND